MVMDWAYIYFIARVSNGVYSSQCVFFFMPKRSFPSKNTKYLPYKPLINVRGYPKNLKFLGAINLNKNLKS